MVWSDVLSHVRESLGKISDVGINNPRAKKRLFNTCSSIIIWEAFAILFLFQPTEKVCRFYINGQELDDANSAILASKQVEQSGLHSEKKITLFKDDEGQLTTEEIDSNGEGPKQYVVNMVHRTVFAIENNVVDRKKNVADFDVKWRYDNEYDPEMEYCEDSIVRYRENEVVYTMKCKRYTALDPLPGNFWSPVEAEINTDEWSANVNYSEGDVVQKNDKHFIANEPSTAVDPIQNTNWEVIKEEYESLLGKYYEQQYDLKNTRQQYDVASLLYCTVPNAITTLAMSQDDILSKGLSKFIKELCNYAKQILMEVDDLEMNRYNHCLPRRKDGGTSTKRDVDFEYVCLGDEYEEGIKKFLAKNFTPGWVVDVDPVFINDSIKEIQGQSTNQVQTLPNSVRIKKTYLKQTAEGGVITETEVGMYGALESDGSLKPGYICRERWQVWKVLEDGSGRGGWGEFDFENLRVDIGKPKKKKIVYNHWTKKYYMYIPYIRVVLETNNEDPFFNSLKSYKIKSDDENETTKILLATPYEGKVTSGDQEKVTCIPWVSNCIELSSTTEPKVIYKHGQTPKEAAETINVHESHCENLEEVILEDVHIDEYANLNHQKNKMMNSILCDVTNPGRDYVNIFKHCCKRSLLKEAHAAQGNYKYPNYPRSHADIGWRDQQLHVISKRRSVKRGVNTTQPTNTPPKIRQRKF